MNWSTMLRWIKQRFNLWSHKFLLREQERLQKENAELRAQIEEETGEAVQFSQEEQERLDKLSRGHFCDK